MHSEGEVAPFDDGAEGVELDSLGIGAARCPDRRAPELDAGATFGEPFREAFGEPFREAFGEPFGKHTEMSGAGLVGGIEHEAGDTPLDARRLHRHRQGRAR
jgi:hypothetical protein